MIDSTPPSQHAPEQPTGFNSFEVWKEYETVAMHFNDLLMRLRTQSLAAVAAFAAIVSVVIKGDISVHVRWQTLAGMSFLLTLFWLAIWILDFTYYNRLLTGAVDALIEIENQTQRSNRVAELVLSTRIEDAVSRSKKSGNGRKTNNCGRWWFYSIVLVALIACLCLSVYSAGGIQAVFSSSGEPTTHASANASLLPTAPKK